jgi:hypothetical protein
MKAPIHGEHAFPILEEDGGDYLDASFQTDVSSDKDEQDPSQTIFHIKGHLNCPLIQAWIDQGLCKFFIIIDQAILRKSFPATSACEFDFKESAKSFFLGRNIEFTPIIVAQEDFSFDYIPGKMDALFGSLQDSSFKVLKGQIIGYGQCREAKTSDPQHISSIFDYGTLPNDSKEPFTVDLSGQRIRLNLKQNISDDIRLIQDRLPSLADLSNAAIGYPVIAYVIQSMLQDGDKRQYEGNLWYTTLTNKLFALDPSFSLSNPDDATDPKLIWKYTFELLSGFLETANDRAVSAMKGGAV